MLLSPLLLVGNLEVAVCGSWWLVVGVNLEEEMESAAASVVVWGGDTGRSSQNVSFNALRLLGLASWGAVGVVGRDRLLFR